MKCKVIKLLGKKKKKKENLFSTLGYGKISKKEHKQKINKLDIIKIKNFYSLKESEKTSHRLGDNICIVCNLQDLVYRIKNSYTIKTLK